MSGCWLLKKIELPEEFAAVKNTLGYRDLALHVIQKGHSSFSNRTVPAYRLGDNPSNLSTVRDICDVLYRTSRSRR